MDEVTLRLFDGVAQALRHIMTATPQAAGGLGIVQRLVGDIAATRQALADEAAQAANDLAALDEIPETGVARRTAPEPRPSRRSRRVPHHSV